MSNRYTYDHLQKKSKWDEQEEMQQHYGPYTARLVAPETTSLEQAADMMASRVTLTRSGHFVAKRSNTKEKPLIGGVLPLFVRRKMELLFGVSFSGVRIYTDGAGAQKATAMGVNAFTVGNDIYFAPGKYQPHTLEGQQLLAHELTHVVQQQKQGNGLMAQDKDKGNIGFTLEFKESIPAGDPRKTALVVFIQQVMGLQDRKKAEKLASKYRWEGSFPAVNYTGGPAIKVEVSISKTTYNNLLVDIYGKDNPVVKGYDQNKDINSKNFDEDKEMRSLSNAAKLRSQLSEEDEELFKKIAKDNPFATPKQLEDSLREFINNLSTYKREYGPVDSVMEKAYQDFLAKRELYNEAYVEYDKHVSSLFNTYDPKCPLSQYDKGWLQDAYNSEMYSPGITQQVKKTLIMRYAPVVDKYNLYLQYSSSYINGNVSRPDNESLIEKTLLPYKAEYSEAGIDRMRAYMIARLDKDAYATMDQKFRVQLETEGSVNSDILLFDQLANQSRKVAADLKIIPATLLPAWGRATAMTETIRQKRNGKTESVIDTSVIREYYDELFKATKGYTTTSTFTMGTPMGGGSSTTTTVYNYMSEYALGEYKKNLGTLKTTGSKDSMAAVIEDMAAASKNMDQYILDRLDKARKKGDVNAATAQGAFNMLDAAGPMTRHLDELKSKHPGAYKVNAFFVGEWEGTNLDKTLGSPQWENTAPLQMYLYQENGEWVLADLSNPFDDEPKENRVTISEGLYALFNKLDSNKRFPRGFISWNVPALEQSGHVRTHAEKTWGDWFKLAGVALGAVLLAVGTLGASIPFELVALSSGLIIAGSIMTMVELHDQNMLDAKTATIEIATIITALMPGVTAAMEKFVLSAALETGTYARLAVLADSYYVRIAPSVIGMAADSVVLITLAAQAKEQLAQIEKMPEGAEKDFARKRIYTSLFITGAISIIGYKANMNGIKAQNNYTKNLALEEIELTGANGNKVKDVIAFPTKLRQNMSEEVQSAYTQNEMAQMFYYGRKMNIPEVEILAFLEVGRNGNAVIARDIIAMAYNNARNGTAGVNALLEELETSGVMKSAGLKNAEKLALQESFRKARSSKNSDLYAEVEISIRKGKWGSIKRQTNDIVKKEAAETKRSDTKNAKFEQPKTTANIGNSALIESLPETLKAVHNRLVNGGMQFVEEGNVIKYLDKNGDEIARIENGVFSVSKEKLSIPEPLTYLDATYITNHINRFKQEGAGFIVVKSWTEQGRFESLPDRKFVGLRSEMDAVIAKYKAQGNDWKVLRDDLNLGPATDLSGEEIYYIKISGDDPRFTYDIPNGNEGGAIVGEWVPGGYTKNGTAEAAIVGSKNIEHGKDINKLLDNFPGMWEKIK